MQPSTVFANASQYLYRSVTPIEAVVLATCRYGLGVRFTVRDRVYRGTILILQSSKKQKGRTSVVCDFCHRHVCIN